MQVENKSNAATPVAAKGEGAPVKLAKTTQAQVTRMIKAALEAGLRVTSITRKPDGAITVETVPLAPSLEDCQARDAKYVVQERIARM